MKHSPSLVAKDDGRSKVTGVSKVEPAFKSRGASERPDSSSQTTHARMCPQYVEVNAAFEDAAHPLLDDRSPLIGALALSQPSISKPSCPTRAIEALVQVRSGRWTASAREAVGVERLLVLVNWYARTLHKHKSE